MITLPKRGRKGMQVVDHLSGWSWKSMQGSLFLSSSAKMARRGVKERSKRGDVVSLAFLAFTSLGANHTPLPPLTSFLLTVKLHSGSRTRKEKRKMWSSCSMKCSKNTSVNASSWTFPPSSSPLRLTLSTNRENSRTPSLETYATSTVIPRADHS
ncbi:hypothetical protein IE53DRAFT_260619 [Violaceomyces palustris]|uniref:Uncharacterized protein n=1 Tax=Violaceomyces palustris TaxID=1673888 RepID=A0ACD0P3I1_9BASI|nr:hypothetical protein IE53DRAFT_260619 [Violaceomyces palustris]